jgi:hypothetical protein
MCWQQRTGVGDEFSALSACKRTRDEAADEAPIGNRESDKLGNLEISGCS